MFRDDLGAANARIAALEAKIAELEQERASMPAKAERRIADLERQLAEARDKAARAEQAARDKSSDRAKARAKDRERDKAKDKAKDQARAPAEGSPARRARTRALLKTLGLVFVGAAALALFLWWSLRTSLGVGEVQAAYWLPGDSGPELLLVIGAYERGESGATIRHRLELRDGKTGQRSARVSTGRDYRLVGVTPGGLWFATESGSRGGPGLHRRDRRSLAVTLTQAAWRSRNKSLGRLDYLGGVLHEPAGGFPLRADDGRHYYLDPETLEARSASALTERRGTGVLDSITGYDPTRQGHLPSGDQVSFEGAERAALACSGMVSSETVLLPELLRFDADDLLTPVGEDAFLVTHRVSLSSKKVQLSLLPCQGPPRWTVDLPGQVDGAARLDLPADQVVFLARKGSGHVLMAIGLEDGALRWRQAL